MTVIAARAQGVDRFRQALVGVLDQTDELDIDTPSELIDAVVMTAEQLGRITVPVAVLVELRDLLRQRYAEVLDHFDIPVPWTTLTPNPRYL